LVRKTSKINGFPYFVLSIPTVRSITVQVCAG